LKTSKTDIIQLRNRFVKSKLRKVSIQWPPSNQVYTASRVERGKHKCNICEKLVHYKEINKDHIEPVEPLKGLKKQENGEVDWNAYIPRLLCDVENYQAICKKCHDIKTEQENEMRLYYREQKRKKNKLKLRK